MKKLVCLMSMLSGVVLIVTGVITIIGWAVAEPRTLPQNVDLAVSLMVIGGLFLVIGYLISD